MTGPRRCTCRPPTPRRRRVQAARLRRVDPSSGWWAGRETCPAQVERCEWCGSRGLAAAVASSGRSVAEVADTHEVSWDTTHRAFVEAGDPGLAAEPPPLTDLGIDQG